MKIWHKWVGVALGVTVAFTMTELAALVGRVRADGAPAEEPLRFSGTITEGGVRINDREKPVSVVIWRSENSEDGTELCRTTPRGGVNVTDGRFSVVLDPACTVALRDNPNAWVEVVVDGTGYGRQRVGAVPYALEATRASNGSPVGSITAWIGDGASPPPGWAFCDGQIVDSGDPRYTQLWNVVHDTYGDGGDGSGGRFAVPDLRGLFLRGLDDGRGLDADRTLGAVYQDGRVGVHDHSISDPGHGHSYNFEVGWGNWSFGGNNWAGTVRGYPASSVNPSTTGIAVLPSAPGETRPVNFAVRYIVRL